MFIGRVVCHCPPNKKQIIKEGMNEIVSEKNK